MTMGSSSRLALLAFASSARAFTRPPTAPLRSYAFARVSLRSSADDAAAAINALSASASAPVSRSSGVAAAEEQSVPPPPPTKKTPPSPAADLHTSTTPKKKKKTPPPPAPEVPVDVSRLDIRVGRITKVWEHPESDKMFCEEIDLGEADGPRQILSGLRAHYKAAELEDRLVLVLANLKTRKLAGVPSTGMVLCAAEGGRGGGGDERVACVDVPAGSVVGERVACEGFEGEPASPNQIAKKKLLEKIFPDLRTDADGVPVYKGVPMTTSAGACSSPLSNCEVA